MRPNLIHPTLFLITVALGTQTAEATFHYWRINEVYSNADGSVQYVDMKLSNSIDDERHLLGHDLVSTAKKLIFDHDLAKRPSKNQHFLVATPGFAGIAGVTPDFTFPASFISQLGDTLVLAGIDSLTFGPLPNDGKSALARDGSIVIPRPTNFAGQVGIVTEPASWRLLLAGVVAVAVTRRRLRVVLTKVCGRDHPMSGECARCERLRSNLIQSRIACRDRTSKTPRSFC